MIFQSRGPLIISGIWLYVSIFWITKNHSIFNFNSRWFKLQNCRKLLPTQGSVVYHPKLWPPGSVPPKASADNPQDVISFWRSELCTGDDILQSMQELSERRRTSAQILERALTASGILKGIHFASDFHLPIANRSIYCNGCDGIIRLTRLRGCNDVQPPLRADFGDPIFELASALGPDELWVTLEGAEFHVLPALHIGQCTYILPFAVTIPGLYRLHALVLRADYAALDEIKYAERFPPVTLDNVVGEKLLLQLGSTLPSEQKAARMTIIEPHMNNHALPLCNSTTFLGRYVRSVPTTNDTFSPDLPPFLMPQVLGVRPMSFFVQLQEEFTYVPYTCRRSPFNAARTAGRCFASKSVNFRGDSQMRIFFNHFMQRVCGLHNAASKTAWYVSTCLYNSSFCQDSSMCLTSDPMAEKQVNITDFEVLAINFGQHPASQFRVPASKYRTMVLNYFKTLKAAVESSKRPTLLLWLETQTLCSSNTEYLHSFGDWRTPHRVLLYNKVANSVLLDFSWEQKVNIVRLTNAQLPMSQLCHDSGHLIGVDNALDAMLWPALDLLCPGWENE
jgi:hypothetical protein